jgi:hypothetical protein
MIYYGIARRYKTISWSSNLIPSFKRDFDLLANVNKTFHATNIKGMSSKYSTGQG